MNAARASLRRRVTLAFTLLGALLSVLFAGATIIISEDYEHILVDELLRGQAEDYTRRLTTHPEILLPRTHRLSGYLVRATGPSDVPAEYRALPPGIHEHESDEEDGIHIGVFDTRAGRLFFVIDLSDIERLERHLAKFLAAVVLIGTGVSGWLGWLLSGATLAPVRRLASAVDALPARAQRTALADGEAPDELGRLAQAIDRYQLRLAEADETERSFFADASHELRTPVAVVRGAVELLVEEPGIDEAIRRRVERLQRGTDELTDLLDALLRLVRRRVSEPSHVEAATLLRTVADRFEGAGANRASFDIEATGTLVVPYDEALLVLQGITRRILAAESGGRLALRADQDWIVIERTSGSEADASTSPSAKGRSDRGIGLALLSRLAAQLGWRLEEPPMLPGRRCVRIVGVRTEP
jgi:hypothetical protein